MKCYHSIDGGPWCPGEITSADRRVYLTSRPPDGPVEGLTITDPEYHLGGPRMIVAGYVPAGDGLYRLTSAEVVFSKAAIPKGDETKP